MKDGNLVVVFLFSTSHLATKQPTEWKVEIWWLFSQDIIDLMVKPVKPVDWAHALTITS